MEANIMEKQNKKGNFFSVSAEVVRTIAKKTSWVEPVLAYLVLAKNKKGGTIWSTGGAPAIADALGVGRQRAIHLIKELEQVGLNDNGSIRAIMAPEVWNKISEEDLPMRMGLFPVKVLPNVGEELIHLPNQLIDGYGAGKANPPLRKINNDILAKGERLDAVNLLLQLYNHNQLVEYGGVNPSFICRKWHELNRVEIPAEAGHDGLHWFGEVQRTLELWLSEELLSMFGGDHRRCLRALNNLERLHLLHEVAMVFDENPLGSNRAEALYPLYAFDRYTREQAEEETPVGGLWEHAAEALARSGLQEELSGEANKSAPKQKDRRFIYGAQSPDATVLSVVRLKYLPLIQDTGIGIQTEKERAGRWKQVFTESFGPNIFSEKVFSFG